MGMHLLTHLVNGHPAHPLAGHDPLAAQLRDHVRHVAVGGQRGVSADQGLEALLAGQLIAVVTL